MWCKIIFLSIFIYPFCLQLSAQDYQAVRSNFLYNYQSTNGEFKGMKTDSVRLQGKDSVFYNFRTYRYNENQAKCLVEPFAASWLGDKVIVREDGSNLFFNKAGDTIMINTQATLNDSWMVLHLAGGQKIEGVVVDIIQDTILGQADSVKIIRLEKQSSNGVPLTDILNGKEIRIAKKMGLVKTIDFYSFPSDTAQIYLVGNENSNAGTTRLSWKQIYDFDIGDQFHYEYRYSNDNNFGGSCNGKSTYNYRMLIETVTGKSVSNDSLIYNVRVQENSYYSSKEPWNNGNSNRVIQSYDTTQVYHMINTKSDSLFPEEYRTITKDNWGDIGIGRQGAMLQYDSVYNNRILQKFLKGHDEGIYTYTKIDSSGCSNVGFHLSPNCTGTEFQYVMGCGKTYESYGCADYCWMLESTFEMVYYKKGEEEWGEPWTQSQILSNNEWQRELETTDLLIHPNPSTGNYVLELGETQNEVSLIVRNISGQTISLNTYPQSSKINFNIDGVAGVYFVEISMKDRVPVQLKVLKN